MSDHDTTVFVVDDDPAIGDSIQLLLRSIGLTSEVFLSGSEFLDSYDPARGGCLVLDVRMPGMSGLDLQKTLQDQGSSLPIIFITAHGDIPMAVSAVKAGAADFIQKPFRDQDLLDKIQTALDLNAQLREEEAQREEIRNRLQTLTPREREVMSLVVQGQLNKNIARTLGISQRTVEIHRARVMDKMQVRSVSKLVQLVMEAGEPTGS